MAEEQKTTSAFDAFVEHQKRALEEASKALDALIPPEFKTHGRTAVNESIEGFRVLVNSVLDDIKTEVNRDAAPEGEAPKSSGKNKVKVEINT